MSIITPAVTSTMTLAPAAPPGTPLLLNKRARTKSPPTCATGNSELIDSPIHRIQLSSVSERRCAPGSSARQPITSATNGTR
jgi:hypothetical protein